MVVSLVMSLLAPGVAWAQGTGVLRGHVVSAGTDSKPVRRALVTVTGEGLPFGRTTVSGDDGAFVFDGLSAGRFVVRATKAAHLPARFGARPGRPAVPIQLGVGETRADVLLTMAAAAVVAGTVRTPTAEPAAGVDVAIFRVPRPGQDLHLIPSGRTTTDDRGMYRVFDLAPGDYVIVALLNRSVVGNGDAAVWTSEDVDRMLKGEPATPESRVSWAPIYFPGSASPQDAVPIRLGVGDERAGLDFTMAMTRMTRVEGVLIGNPEVVGSARIFWNASGLRLEPLVGLTPVFTTRTTPTGKEFTYTGVPPGVFSVTAQIAGQAGGDAQWARASFQSSGQDVIDLVLTPQPAVQLSGRIVFEGVEGVPPGALAGATVRVRAANGMGQSASGSTVMGNPMVPAGQVAETGAFEVRGIVPETFFVDVVAPKASGWIPQSVVVNGTDVLDGPIAIDRDITDVVVTMSRQKTKLSGRITTPDGAPGTSLFIAVFPQDQSLWRPVGRRTTSARADTDGRWVIEFLPPGDYFVVALTDVMPDELSDPTFLAQLVPSALRVTLAPGEQRTQDLRIGGQ